MKKAFVPICLYNNGFFLKGENLRFFLYIFSDYDEIMFVIVDRLYGNNLLIKNKVHNLEEAITSYNKRGGDIYSFTNKIVNEYMATYKLPPRIQIVRWDNIASDELYISLKKDIELKFADNLFLSHYSNMFIVNNLKKMTSLITDDKFRLEYDYLFSEIAMSIYMTEFLGYTNEVWEKPQDLTLPDPINVLYSNEKETLYSILKKESSFRVQSYLSEIINNYIKCFESDNSIDLKM